MCSTSRRSSRRAIGSPRTNRSVSRITPTLKLLASAGSRAAPSVISTLPPPMSMTTPWRFAEIDAVGRGDVNQPGLLGARDHPHVDAGAIADRGEEVAAVLGLAGGAGRRRDDLVDLVRVGQPPELGERLEAAGHRRRRQRPAVEAAGAEPDHLLLAVDDLEGLIRADLRHDHVHGVGADVDRGQAHGGHSTMSAGHPDMRATSTASLRRRASPRAAARADDRTPLAQSLGRRVEALAGHLHAALDGDERAIHQARVATRRLREIVPIVIDTRSAARRAAAAPAEAPDRRARPGARAGRRPGAVEHPRRGRGRRRPSWRCGPI